MYLHLSLSRPRDLSMVAYKCHPHNEIDFSFQIDLKLVSRLQVVKVFSTTGRDSALKCHRLNEKITRQFKFLSRLKMKGPYTISTSYNETYLHCSYDTALKCRRDINIITQLSLPEVEIVSRLLIRSRHIIISKGALIYIVPP